MLEAGSSAAVLGASGFIGSAIARALEHRGTACARYTRAEPFMIDGQLAPELQSADVVFWLVSSIRPATSDAADRATADQSALQLLLDRLAERPRSPRVVAVSSGGTVYDTATRPPYHEASPTRGANAYGEAMLAVEQLLRDRAPDHVVLRASNAYGPGQPARRGQGVIAHWIDSIRREEPIRLIGDPEIRRDYLFIDDLVDALLRSAFVPGAPAVVNIGSGVGTSLRELSEELRDVVGGLVEMEAAPARSFDAPSTWLDVSLAASTLGWHPSTDLHSGLAATWKAAIAADR
ncbi:MAG: UDP-glucose 4-epimerase [Pseudonocardiales bacterium]|jgi:UDP-glucose 4-epimerase|nr:UDP-glucose 4-epimerase [Pseudonocardiales bacterium]